MKIKKKFCDMSLGEGAEEIIDCFRVFSESQHAEIVELNVCMDHVHVLVSIPPKVSVSNFVGTIKGRTALRVFNKFRKLKHKPYWGAIIFGPGDTVLTQLA